MSRPSDRAIAAAFWEISHKEPWLREAGHSIGALSFKLAVDERARELDTEPRAGDGDALVALRDALAYVGQRSDGDLATLAERAELWMRESQSLLAAQRNEGDGE